jgi:RNA polymerase sigma factor (sigma-70 family)
MADPALQSILRQLRRLAAPKGATVLADAHLLRRFVETRDEAAFEVLVWRHGPMVLGSCRKLLGHAQDAEDAFQATFLTLARKAGSITQGTSLAGWLHRVAYHIALRLRSQRHRQALQRQDTDLAAVAGRREGSAGIEDWELWGVLSEELQRLPARYRLPLIACYLQGKTHADAARELERPLGSMSRDLARGCELMRDRLVGRGVSLSAGTIVTVLTEQASAALAPSLVLPAVTAALDFSAGVAVPTPAAALAKGMIQSMLLSKVKVVAGVLVVLGVLGGGVTGLARQVLTQPTAPAQRSENDVAHPEPGDARAARLDPSGDPLPDEAVARLGTTRFRSGGNVRSLHYSPDGTALIACGAEGACTIDVATGKVIHRFPKESASMGLGGGLSADGKWLATVGSSLHLWEMATGKLVRTLEGARFSGACFSPDGKLLSSLGGDPLNEISLWDPATGRRIRSWTTGDEACMSFTFLSNSQTLVTASTDRTVRFWDIETGKERRPRLLFGPPNPQRLVVSPEGALLALHTIQQPAGIGSWIYLWDVATSKEIRQIVDAMPQEKTMRPPGFGPLAFAPDGKSLLVGGIDRHLRLYDLTAEKEPRQVWQGPCFFRAVAASPDGKTAAVAAGDSIHVVDLASGTEVVSPAGHPWLVTSTAFTPDGRTAITACDSALYLWDVASGELRRRLQAHPVFQDHNGNPNLINGLQILDNGRRVVSCAGQDGLRVWDLGTEKEISHFPSPGERWLLQAVAPDGRMVAVESGDTVVLIDMHTGKEVRRLTRQRDRPYGNNRADFTPDGRTLVVYYGKDRKTCLWDVASGRITQEYVYSDENPAQAKANGQRSVSHAALSPDRRILALGSGSRFLELRDLGTGTLLNRLDKLPDGVFLLDFSPDGKMLAWAGVAEPTIHLIEVATGRERLRFRGQIGRVRSLSFNADGTRLISGGADTTAIIWDLTGRLRGTEALGQPLTAADLDACWADLAGADAPKAYRAIQRLAAAPREATAYLQPRLQPASGVDEKRVARLIADLDKEDFAARQAAAKELETFGEQAFGLCRKALDAKPALETRRRLEELIEKVSVAQWQNPSPERLRTMRAVEVLERIGTPEAQQVLESLAKGSPEARLTQEAKASLERLAKRSAARL